MHNKFVFTWLIVLLVLLPLNREVAAVKNGEIDRIIEQIDNLNRFPFTFTSEVAIKTYAPKKRPKTSEYALYGRGLDQILLCQTAPKLDYGKKILMKKDKMWFYFPKAKQSIIVNPSSSLFGTVSIGDVLSPPLLDIYKYEGYQAEANDGKNLLTLTFSATSTRAPYGKLIYYYEATRIIRCEAFTRSGILLKVAYYQEYAAIPSGGEYASLTRIESGVNKEFYSLIKTTNLVKEESLPDSYFVIEGLDKINVKK